MKQTIQRAWGTLRDYGNFHQSHQGSYFLTMENDDLMIKLGGRLCSDKPIYPLIDMEVSINGGSQKWLDYNGQSYV
jgi:hypothetical protein